MKQTTNVSTGYLCHCLRITAEDYERMLERGEMHPAGIKEVDAAKADGRWDTAYDSQARSTTPDDLAAALAANPGAADFFGKLNGVNRYAVLYRVQTAVKPETRAKRIADFVAMLAQGRAIYPQ